MRTKTDIDFRDRPISMNLPCNARTNNQYVPTQACVIFTGSGWNGLLLDCVRPVLLDPTAGYGKCQ